MKQNILKHELKYISLFSKIKYLDFGYEAEDFNQRDKYYHNQLHLLNHHFSKSDIDDYASKNKKHGFAVYRVEGNLNLDLVKAKDDILSHDAIYGNFINQIKVIKKNDIDITIVNPADDSLFFNYLYEDSAPFGVSYAKGNVVRQKEVLSQNKNSFFYLQAIKGGDVVGMLNAYVDHGLAKIDDFTVKDNLQKSGIGSALMHEMLNILKSMKVDYAYLVTDQEDTPKDMYQKWGFQFISDYYVVRKTLKTDE